MKNLLRIMVLASCITSTISIVADYWKCQDDETHYVSKNAALKSEGCTNPQKCHEECESVFVEKRGLLGHGGIAGTGIGQARGHSTRKCKEVCEPSGKGTEQEAEIQKSDEGSAKATSEKSGKNCRQECHTEFEENPGLLGHGGIAGTGIGQARGRAREVCEEVCD